MSQVFRKIKFQSTLIFLINQEKVKVNKVEPQKRMNFSMSQKLMFEADTKEQNYTICVMEKEYFTIMKVVNTSANGSKIKCSVKEFSTIPITKLLTMENGEMINLKAKELCTTNKFCS